MKILMVIVAALLFVIPLSYPGWFFLGWLAILPLLYVLEKSSGKKGVLLGWLFGFVFMAATSYWLFIPIQSHTGIPVPIILILLVILFALLGLFYALWSYLYLFIKPNNRFSPFFVALSWTALEYFRYTLLTVFPFGFAGYTQVSFSSLLQFAELGGVFLLSFIVILFGGFIFNVLYHGNRKSILALIGLLIIILGAGYFRYYQVERFAYEEISTGVINTNVPQEDKWEPDMVKDNLQEIVDKAYVLEETDLIITPETSLTFDLLRNSYYKEIFLKKIEGHDTYFQVGSQARGEEGREMYNSSFLISPRGEILQRYNKMSLVPFGEYLPLEGLVNRLFDLNIGSQTPGREIVVFSNEFGSFINPICSEILNPDFIRKNAARAQFIVNQSNEAWFGVSNLQRQMWTAAVFRAVENRRSVARSGNYARAGVVFPSGKTHFSTSPKTVGAQNSKVYLHQARTFYQRAGNFAGLGSLLILLLMVVIKGYRKWSKRNS